MVAYEVIDSFAMFAYFFFNDTATTEIYTLSLHDALPISASSKTTRGTSAGFPELLLFWVLVGVQEGEVSWVEQPAQASPKGDEQRDT